jgi:hypothetical protein
VRTEGREARLDRLFIADIGIDVVEHRDGAFGIHRRRNPGLHHDRDDPDRLQQHGLAAGVGPRDEERPLVGPHRKVERHDLRALGRRAREQERVPRTPEREAAPRR